MKTQLNHRVTLIATVFLFSVASLFAQLPKQLVGNWINEQNNDWEIGLYEDFAVYKSDFWSYSEITTDRKDLTQIEIEREGKKVRLAARQIDDSHIGIRFDKAKEAKYIRMEKQYPPYRTKDTSQFASPNFRIDSATIIGYYRNLDKIPEAHRNQYNYNPIEVSVSDFLTGEERKHYADIDSLGRFKITFLVMNTQQVFFDWERLTRTIVVEPGDELFIFADLHDYVPIESDQSYEAYRDRPKQVCYMGDNARLNNEICRYRQPMLYINRHELKDLSDMEYLKECENVYNQRMEVLKTYLQKYPTASDKFITYMEIEEKFNSAFYLMQHRFDKYRMDDKKFDNGYLEYVEANFPLDNELEYTMVRHFGTFLVDYMGYVNDIHTSPFFYVLPAETIERLTAEGKAIKEIEDMVEKIDRLTETFNVNKEDTLIRNELGQINSLFYSNEIVRKTNDELVNEKIFLNPHIGDSLIKNNNLKELWRLNGYLRWFENKKSPLSDYHFQNVLQTRLTNPDLLDYVNRLQTFYTDIANKDMDYAASLKNTEHLKEYDDADKLFNELIAPYHGNVIYVDFWGTWCGPCRENMKFAYKVKEQLEGKNVVFMYFANNSPKESWNNVIKEMNLTGENIVHYRLPDVQQAMIERKFSIAGYPTYMIIDKEGKVVNSKAASPKETEMAVKEISKWLAD